MAKNSGKFKRYVMSYSFQGRKAREIAHYKLKVKELKSMDNDEIDLEYINLTTEYEYKKNGLTIFIISIAIAVLMNLWKYFYMFMEKAIQYAVSNKESGVEVAKVTFLISLSVIIFMTLMIFAILINYTKELREVHKNLMIVEEIRNKRNNKTKEEI